MSKQSVSDMITQNCCNCDDDTACVRQQLKSLRQCQSLDEIHRLADSGEHDRVIDLLLPLFDGDQLFDMSAASDRHARSLLLMESFLSLKTFEVLLDVRCVISFIYTGCGKIK